MFYYFIILQATIYNAEDQIITKARKYALYVEDTNESLTGMDRMDELHKIFRASINKHEQSAINYKQLVTKFLTKFIMNPIINQTEISFQIIILKNYKSEYIKEFCDDIKSECYIMFGITNKDFEFECAFNLFVEFAIFAMDTFKAIFDIRKDTNNDNEFNQILIKNSRLFEDYILAVNLPMLLLGYQPQHLLLHNYKSIEVSSRYVITDPMLYITYDSHNNNYDLVSPYFLNNIRQSLFDFYKNNDFSSNEKIFILENMQNQSKCMLNIANINNGDYINEYVMLFNVIAMCRSTEVRIPYIVNSSYYINYQEITFTAQANRVQFFFITDLKREIMKAKNLKTATEADNLFTMDINPLRMHTLESIGNIFKLPNIFIEKIEYLTEFSDLYIDSTITRTKELYKVAITEYLDFLIKMCSINYRLLSDDLLQTKLTCLTEIDAIKTPAQEKKYNKIERLNLYSELSTHEKYFNKAYLHIFEQIKIYEEKTKYPAYCVHKITKDMEILYQNRNNTTFYGSIEKTIEILRKIIEEYKKIEYGGNDMIRTYMEEKFFNCYKNENTYKKLLHQQNEEVEKTDINKESFTITYDESISQKQFDTFIKANKTVITSIIANIQKMKIIINCAEKDALEMFDSFRKHVKQIYI